MTFWLIDWYMITEGTYRPLQLVGEFQGRPSYMDRETGRIYCPFKNQIPAFPPTYGEMTWWVW